MRLPFVLMLVGCTLLGACSGVDAPSDAEAQAEVSEKPEKIETPWKLAIESQRNAGSKIQSDDPFGSGETKTLEAAGNWMVVMLSVENSTAQKQSAKDVFALGTARLVDASGKEYDSDSDASASFDQAEILDKKPFAPGEARSVKLVFDVPKGAKPKSIKVLGDDVKQQTQEFTVSF